MKKNDKKNQETALKILWKRLYSMKFGIGILIALGIASIIAIALGEFFPANVVGGEATYIQKMGLTKFRILKVLGVFNPYRSFWYIGILGFLTLSTLVCTLRRLPIAWRLTVHKSFKSSKDDILTFNNGKSFKTKRNIQEINAKLALLLKKKFYKVESDRQNSTIYVFAQRGRISHWGVVFLHLGLVITVFGGLMASLFGYSVYRWGGEGDVLSVPERKFNVRVDDFTIQKNQQGQVKDYLCTLTVLEDGQKILAKKIEVNKPLRYKGINFYQSSYRADPRAVESVRLKVRSTIVDLGQDEIILTGQNEATLLAGSPYSFRIVDFAGNFRLEKGKVYSMPGINEFLNPAVKLSVLDDNGEPVKNGWVFSPRMAGFHNFLEGYQFELIGFEKVLETGLNVTQNPGASWIWTGLTLMTVGILMAFSLTHKRIWGIIDDVKGKKQDVTLGGVANKNKEDFNKEIKTLIKQLQ